MKRLKFIKAGDIILVAVLCAVLLVTVLLKGNNECKAVVYVDGKVYEELELYKNEYTLSVEGVVLYVDGKGGITVKEADCPDGLCKDMGRRSRAGGTIACVPNKVVVVLEKSNDRVDGVTG